VVTRVCVSVCVCVYLSAASCSHYCMDPDVTWGSGRGCPLVVHCWADLQSVIGARVALLWQHNVNPSYYKLASTPRYQDIVRARNVSECCVLAVCLVSLFGRPFVKQFALCYQTVARFCLSVCLSVCLSACDVGVLWTNGWMDQDATRWGGRPWPRPHCLRWGPSSAKKGTAPNFWPMSVVAELLDGSRCHLVRR